MSVAELILFAYTFLASELKRRQKAEKKAAEKEAKAKEQTGQKKENEDKGEQNLYSTDEESLDPNVSCFKNSERCHIEELIGPQIASTGLPVL